ncbi:tRNA synthetases class I (M)-domain-containing protein [Hygrophoropsis aurantiaca]|uniref:tRNA synthetases class I (M)-domain-containing protein n=1 Tax=Hygrophoropsis aurantiaca TaxID=72124 RepID=A0ACB8AR11_9AGAM|nr:tRNA synthetases class I (M)-domain-containing protein [Hygrophoropsis aurantiaca]
MTQKIRVSDAVLRSIPDPGQTAILPEDGETNILITSALPYCNNVPHLGNIIGSTLSADVFSRYSRTRNRRTLYICGTDEYGTATETQALKEGVSPQELCIKYNALHKSTYEWFDIGFDYFGRTPTQHHTEICQSIYLNLGRNGYLEKQVKDQTYCEGCQKFLADRYVEGICPHCAYADARGDQCDGCSRTLDAIDLLEPRCLINKTHTVVARSSSHMYFKLDSAQPQLEEWIKESYKKGKWSPNATINSDGEIVDARMKGGLRPTPVTRDLSWGVPIPPLGRDDDEEMRGKVLYVWFDAVIGYPSITANYTPDWKRWWHNPDNVKLYQFMGKDNVYFHTIYFPAMLLADGRNWTTLHHVSTTEYLNYEGGKFSKSKNRGVFGPMAKETGIPASVWRYYLLSTRPETADSMFSWSDCIAANNNVLLSNFGNFVNRALKFVSSQYDSIIPDSDDVPGPLSPNDEQDADFINEVNTLLKEYIDAMESVKLRLGLQTVMLISGKGNGYLQASGLNKALIVENPKRCAQVISRTINLIYTLSVLIYPFMPATSESILAQLNAPARVVPDMLSIDILGGHQIGQPEHLFKKIDEKMEEQWKVQFGGSETPSKDPEVAVSKRKAKKVAATNAKVESTPETGPKSPEVTAKELKVAEQGQIVRSLKESKASKEDIDIAVTELKKLKGELMLLEKA